MEAINELLQASIQAHQIGDLGTAAKGYAAILRAQPNLSDAWHLAGLVAHQSGKSEEGILYIERALKIQEHAEYFSNLAAIHHSRSDFVNAERFASRALEIDPEFPAAHFRRGVSLARLGQAAEAMEHFQKALDAEFAVESTLIEVALLFQSIGDIPSTIRAFEVSLGFNPNQPTIYYNLSKLALAGMYELSSEQVSYIEQLTQTFSGVPSELGRMARYHFALGSHFEKHEAFHVAFKHYEKGNACATQQLLDSECSDAFAERPNFVKRLSRFFDQRQVSCVAPRKASHPQPIFVVGLPRSGTSLVAQILGSHPEIQNADELTAMMDCVAPWSSIWESDKALSFGVAEATKVRDSYLQLLASSSQGAPFVVDKMPENFQYLGFAHQAFPESPIFYCRRDPRDIALSSFSLFFDSDRLRWETATLERIGKTIREHVRLQQHWQSIMPDRMVPVFYERLVSQGEQQIRRIISAAQVSWSDSCLRPHESQSAVTTASMVQVRKPIYQSSLGRWETFAEDLLPLFELIRDEIEQYEIDLSNAD